jgi:hypothetical protein
MTGFVATLLDDLNGTSPAQADQPGCRFTYSGKPCERKAVVQSGFCLRHGGNPDSVNEDSAQGRRMLELRGAAIDALDELIMFSPDDKVKLSAALAVLDRTGLGPKSTLTVEEKAEDLSKLTLAQLQERQLRYLKILEQHYTEQKASAGNAAENPPDGPANIH